MFRLLHDREEPMRTQPLLAVLIAVNLAPIPARSQSAIVDLPPDVYDVCNAAVKTFIPPEDLPSAATGAA